MAELETGAGDTRADADESVRAILRQLGSPQDIVAAAASDLPNTPTDSRTEPAGSAAREAFALILLLVGGALFWIEPGVAWIALSIGLILLCVARRWTVRDKFLGAAGLALAPIALTGIIQITAGTETCTDGGAVPAQPTSTPVLECTTSAMPSAAGTGLIIILLAVTAFATIRLARRLRQP